MDYVERTRAVEKLLRVKYPFSWAPPPISPVGSRKPFDDGSHHRQMMQAIEAERTKLMALTDGELQSRYDAAATVEQAKTVLKEQIAEKGRAFNWPSADADFEYWAKADLWTLDEATALLLGKSPEVVSWKILQSYVNVSAFARKYQRLRNLALRAEALNEGKSAVRPVAVIDWAKDADLAVPAALQKAVEARASNRRTPGTTAQIPQTTSEAPPVAVTDEVAAPTDRIAKRARLLARFRELGGKRPSEGGKKGTRGALAQLQRETHTDDKNLGQMLDKAIEEKRGADAWAQLRGERPRTAK